MFVRRLSSALPRLSARANALQRHLPPSSPPPKHPTVAAADDAHDPLCAAMALIEPRLRGSKALGRRECTRALALSGWREAQSVLRIMAHEGLPPGPYDLALAAHAFARDGQTDLAAQVRSRLLDEDALLRRASPQTLSMVLRGCWLSEDAPGALAAWERMRSRGQWPTVPGLQHLLMACAEAGAWRPAIEALRAAEAEQLPTDVRQWNAVLKACVRAGAMHEAEKLLLSLPNAESDAARAADSTSFNTVLHGYAGDWAGAEGLSERVARAEALLARMDAAGVPRDEVTYATLLQLHRFDPQQVNAIAARTPTVLSSPTHLRANCCPIWQAMQLLAEAKRRGVHCGAATYGKAVRTLLWARLAEPAWQLIHSMETAGVQPDAQFYEAAVRAAESVGLLDDADRLHRDAQQRGLVSV